VPEVVAIVVAAGVGTRFLSATPKQFLPLLGKPLVAHTLERFQESGVIDRIVLVLPPEGFDAARQMVAPFVDRSVRLLAVSGGNSRQASVRNGLFAVEAGFAGLVAVHDGARPCVPPSLIARVVTAATEDGGAIAALPVVETLKQVTPELLVEKTVDRERFYRAQTPQCFRYELLKRAFDRAEADGFEGTDEAALVERLGAPIRIVPGSEQNLKVTTAEDLSRAEYFLSKGDDV
jgi:2-C-methyl-D-erythritol 4-phosphate cytidylyltransferase